MIDIEAVADAFLAIVLPARKERVKRHLDVLVDAYRAGAIYNTQFKDAKDALGRALEEAWKAATDHFWHGSGGQTADSAFQWYIGGLYGMHEVLSRKKKFDKLKPEMRLSSDSQWKVKDVSPEYIRVVGIILNAAYPLAMLLQDLKDKIIKGKKPDPVAQAKKAAALALKDMKTCPCCFRSIARLKNGNVADHGYTLPQRWAKTASCPGRNFKPLEVSDEGLKYMVKMLTGSVADLRKALAAAPNKKTLRVKKGWGKETEEITPDSPKWDAALQSYTISVETDLRYAEQDLAEYSKKLREWKPTEIEESLRDLINQLTE